MLLTNILTFVLGILGRLKRKRIIFILYISGCPKVSFVLLGNNRSTTLFVLYYFFELCLIHFVLLQQEETFETTLIRYIIYIIFYIISFSLYKIGIFPFIIDMLVFFLYIEIFNINNLKIYL